MADYVPLYLPGQAVNSTASASITGGQPVYVSGSGTVANSATAANIPVGVAAFDAASGAGVGYFARGTVHRLTASGTVTAGDVVEAAAAGAVATHTVGTNDARGFGIALTTATTGNSVEIMEV
jgi:hypothetical protein